MEGLEDACAECGNAVPGQPAERRDERCPEPSFGSRLCWWSHCPLPASHPISFCSAVQVDPSSMCPVEINSDSDDTASESGPASFPDLQKE